jgi:hypothetical protein
VPGEQQIMDRAIPLGESYIDLDGYGRLGTFHRQFTLTPRQIVQRFGPVDKIDETKTGDITIIHAVTKNPDYQPGRIGLKGKLYSSVYCAPDVKDLHRVGGYYEMPYFVATWNERSGKVYPTGPGHIARADMRTLQEMERTHLVAGQFAAEPPLALNQDSEIVREDVTPGAMLYGAWGENGKPMYGVINRGQSLQLSMQQSQQRREAIREAFYFSLMQLASRPQMTASEFLGFKEENLRRLGPHLLKLQINGLTPLLARRYQMLQRAGQLPPPPPEIQGQKISVEYVSPLAKAQKLAEGRAVLQWIGAVGQLGQLDPQVMDNVDTDAAAIVLHDAFGPPLAVRRAEDQIDALRKARGKRGAQSEQLQNMAQQAQIYADVSHAEQAKTLAKQRA